ncbi:MAG: hypothetical protein LBK66_07545 [Spirochaetaceae bacterium]|jgi:hypothetical protein|nr:hypothetical protein [Spirochaetaceae bacterium]
MADEIIMTNEEKVEKIKALIEEINELSKGLSEEYLAQVSGGGYFIPHIPERVIEAFKRRYPNGPKS